MLKDKRAGKITGTGGAGNRLDHRSGSAIVPLKACL